MSLSIPDTPVLPAADCFPTLPLVLRFAPEKRMKPQEYFDFCMANPELRLEQSATGDLIIQPSTGALTSSRNCDIGAQLRMWAKKNGAGTTFDSNTEFRLPCGSARNPDATWLLLTRWNSLSQEEQEQFPPLCPDFVLELRSYNESLKVLQGKMEEYLANGARLGWLVDPYSKQVHIYRPNREPEILDDPKTVSGESVLPGFELDLTEIFPKE